MNNIQNVSSSTEETSAGMEQLSATISAVVEETSSMNEIGGIGMVHLRIFSDREDKPAVISAGFKYFEL